MDVTGWRTSSFTDDGQACVEVAPAADGVLIRDTKDAGTGPILHTSHDQWADFLATRTGLGLRESELTTTHADRDVTTRWHLHDSRGGTLHFTNAEWTAFWAGAANGEFTFQ